MKTNLRFKELEIVLVLLFSTFIFSCTKEIPVDVPESGLILKSAENPQPGDIICDLIAGQTINVGHVVYSRDGDNLLVDYVTTGDWTLSEVHFYVGNLANFKETCMNKTAIQIGKFPYSATNLNSTTHNFSMSLAGITPDIDGYMVVAHAVVKKIIEGGTIQEETAFANCTYNPLLITVKVTFNEKGADGYNKWAATEGMYNFNNLGWWCPWLGTNIFEKGEVTEYKLQSWMFPVSAGGAGEVEVSDDGVNLSIIVTPKEGLTLQTTYLFVGTMDKLMEYGEDTGGCPNYMLFPYQNSDATPTHNFSFSLPPTMSNSISFQSPPLNSNRWGWFSYYNL